MIAPLLLLTMRGDRLAADLDAIAAGPKARVGIAVWRDDGLRLVAGDARFSLQSLTKLVTAAATMEAVDRGRDRLDATITIRRKDLSLNVQPLAERVGPKGFKTTVGDLVRRAVIESDSAANDVLFARLGGAPRIRAFLARQAIQGIRIDRDERHLQTETSGLVWRPEYVDPEVYERAKRAVPPARKSVAYQAYRRDPRDTATPRGMATFLRRLAEGRMLRPDSTRFLRRALAECRTSPDRLKAGVSRGWRLEHKTGTSGTDRGLTVATNDAGIAVDPRGRFVVLVAFVADSTQDETARAALMARIARAATRP